MRVAFDVPDLADLVPYHNPLLQAVSRSTGGPARYVGTFCQSLRDYLVRVPFRRSPRRIPCFALTDLGAEDRARVGSPGTVARCPVR